MKVNPRATLSYNQLINTVREDNTLSIFDIDNTEWFSNGIIAIPTSLIHPKVIDKIKKKIEKLDQGKKIGIIQQQFQTLMTDTITNIDLYTRYKIHGLMPTTNILQDDYIMLHNLDWMYAYVNPSDHNDVKLMSIHTAVFSSIFTQTGKHYGVSGSFINNEFKPQWFGAFFTDFQTSQMVSQAPDLLFDQKFLKELKEKNIIQNIREKSFKNRRIAGMLADNVNN